MELAGIIRVLGRRWVVVVLGALAALAAGIYSSYRVSLAPPGLESRQTSSASALTRVFVDTPNSLISEAQPVGTDTIVDRAVLLANLVASDEISAEIARGAGLRPSVVGVVRPSLGDEATLTALTRQATDVVKPVEPHLVTLSVDPTSPIISILAEAPSPGSAARLGEAATAALGSLAPQPQSVGNRAVRIEQLGPAEIEAVANGPGPAAGLGVAAVLFVAWCLAVVVFDGLARRRLPSAALADGGHA